MPITRFFSILFLYLSIAASPATAKLERFELDPIHTRIAFSIDHAGFSKAIGTFSGSHGTLSFDEQDWSLAQLEVRLPISSLDLGDANWREKILDASFFDAEKFPEARFVATRIEKTGEHSATVAGDLTLHGVTRPVTLAVTLNALKRHPLTFKRTAGFSASTIISRKEFGMTAWGNLVGDEVGLTIEVEAIRQHTKAEPTEPNNADSQ